MKLPQTACPRCGYDQSGAIALWNYPGSPACPLTQICTECGLEFAWGDVLNPAYSRRTEMFEHARQYLARCAARTWWRGGRPWRFWSWIRMEHTIVPRRLGMMMLLGVLLTHLACACATLAISTAVRLLGQGSPTWGMFNRFSGRTSPPELLLDALWPLGPPSKFWYLFKYRGPWRWQIFITPWEAVALGAGLLMPVTFVILGTSLRRAKVRRAHILRVWLYGMMWLVLMLELPGLLTALGSLVDVSLTYLWQGTGVAGQLGLFIQEREGPLTFIAVCVWQVLWWTFACGRYLRLPHAAAIAVLMAAVSGLVCIVTALLVMGGEFLLYYW